MNHGCAHSLGGQPDPQDVLRVKVPLSPSRVPLPWLCMCLIYLAIRVLLIQTTSAGGPYKALHQETRWNPTTENSQDGFVCPENSNSYFNLGHNNRDVSDGEEVQCQATMHRSHA